MYCIVTEGGGGGGGAAAERLRENEIVRERHNYREMSGNKDR